MYPLSLISNFILISKPPTFCVGGVFRTISDILFNNSAHAICGQPKNCSCLTTSWKKFPRNSKLKINLIFIGPENYPFAYFGGKYCCYTGYEKPGDGPQADWKDECNGSKLYRNAGNVTNFVYNIVTNFTSIVVKIPSILLSSNKCSR